MNERQLQSKMVIEFSQQFPEQEGQLFAVRNTTFSVKDGATQKAMGMKKGVSDLIYLDLSGVMIGIEVKCPGTAHTREHILEQYIWGEKIESVGGEYYIVTSLDAFMRIIKGKELTDEIYPLSRIKELLDSDRKTIIF